MVIGFLSLFKDFSMLLSIDDKAKVKIGVPGVSHLVKSKKYFLSNLGPQTEDHDFPIGSRLLIIPFGN